ncbi:MAG: hypothetical protein LBK25_00535 [Treponema sp.]|nr:hypothetical protein [Treponema sp.]
MVEDPRRGSGDRGAHHKGACLPTSVVENRAPSLYLWRLPCGGAPFGCFKSILLRACLRRRTLRVF